MVVRIERACGLGKVDKLDVVQIGKFPRPIKQIQIACQILCGKEENDRPMLLHRRKLKYKIWIPLKKNLMQDLLAE